MRNELSLEDISPIYAEYHDKESSFKRKGELVERLANKYIRKLDPYNEQSIGKWKRHLQYDWVACLDACQVEAKVRDSFAEILECTSLDAAYMAQKYVCDERLRNRIRDIINMVKDDYRRPYFVIDMFKTSERFVENVINDVRYLVKDEWRKAKIYIGTQKARRRFIMWIQDDSSPREFRYIEKSNLRTNNAYIDIRYETNRVDRRGIVIDVRSCVSSGVMLEDGFPCVADLIVLRMSEEEACDLLTMLDSLLEKPCLIRAEIHMKKLSLSLRSTAILLINMPRNFWIFVCRKITDKIQLIRSISGKTWSIIGVVVGVLGLILRYSY